MSFSMSILSCHDVPRRANRRRSRPWQRQVEVLGRGRARISGCLGGSSAGKTERKTQRRSRVGVRIETSGASRRYCLTIAPVDHDTLDRLRQTHATWRLLAADHSPLILSFLALAFIQPNRRTIPAPELVAHLDTYLDQLRESHGAERYPRTARQYLDDWASLERGYLRKYYPKSGEDAEFDLTPAAEKAIDWIQGLRPQQFVGTESRLLTLFHLLRDLATRAQDDPAARIQELERRRGELEHEIERVRTGQAGPLDTTQVKERYLQVEDTARHLLGDFRQVEENFRGLDVQTRERVATSALPKGSLLEEIFGETDHIRRSDQGKSFDAFWEFLMSPARQDELQAWLRRVHELSAVRELPQEEFVRNIPFLLLDAGEKVHGTVAQLVEQLRRFVDDQAHLENRRILDLIREIETHAIRLRADPPHVPAFAMLDALAPEFSLPLCRTLYRPPRNPVLDLGAIEAGDAELNLGALFAQTAVDEKLLRERVAELLRSRVQVTLAEVTSAFPPEHGLAEVVAYLRIAGNDGAAVDESVTETLVIPASGEKAEKRVRLPRVIFTE